VPRAPVISMCIRPTYRWMLSNNQYIFTPKHVKLKMADRLLFWDC